MKGLPNAMAEQNAGCSALCWTTEDGTHLWGRNFDFNRIGDGTKIAYLPRGTEYYTCGTELEHNLDRRTRCRSAYAALGVGFLHIPTTPVLYEGINEKGLMGGQLYYRCFSHFSAEARPGTLGLQPPFADYHLLAQCATVEEVVREIRERATLLSLPLFGTVPTIHWSFSDRSGESIVIEPDSDGLHIYRDTIGIMTNSPGYPWHRLNLLNYAGIRDLDYDALQIEGDSIPQCFSGSGAQGLPGDWTSPSRFVRLAFLKQYARKGSGEVSGVARMFHLFQSVSFPLGIVRVSDPGHLTRYDTGIVPFDYTIYTAILCAESLRFYWTTYENQRIQCLDLLSLLGQDRPLSFEWQGETDILYHTGVPHPQQTDKPGASSPTGGLPFPENGNASALP